MNEEKYPEVTMPQGPPEKVLKGQKALVTGANSGIGKAVAIALGQAGADVVVNYVRGDEQANEVVNEIQKAGSRSHAHAADVSKEDQVQAMFQKIFSELGTLDILINNAGLQKDSPFTEMTMDDWNLVINVNLTGQFLCAREAVREFKRRGVVKEVSCAAGKIIHMSSVHEVIPWAGHVNYAASKGGVMLMMKSIAQEVAPYRIRVIALRRVPSAHQSTQAPGRHRKPMPHSWNWCLISVSASRKILPGLLYGWRPTMPTMSTASVLSLTAA